MTNEENKTVAWLFGRGASVSCGLKWTEPCYCRYLPREFRTQKIRKNINGEMKYMPIGENPYAELLKILESSTSSNWKHLFITVNWDWLLQREIQNKNFETQPRWLVSSHVYHLNGSVEPNFPQQRRNKILFESDSFNKREPSLETDTAISQFFGSSLFIIVGMSFQCKMDKIWFDIFRTYQGNLSIGVANWIVVTHDNKSCCNVCYNLRQSLEDPTIVVVNKKFENWIKSGLPELVQYGVMSSVN